MPKIAFLDIETYNPNTMTVERSIKIAAIEIDRQISKIDQSIEAVEIEREGEARNLARIDENLSELKARREAWELIKRKVETV